MDLGVRDRVALVVGGSSGLGRAVARELLREKARVVIAARHDGRLRDAAETLRRETGGQIATISADVTRPEDVDRMVEETVERWGRLDIVLANAGGPRGGTFESVSPEQFEHGLQLNLMSTVRLAQSAVPHMKRRRWGRFIALTSVSVRRPLPGLIVSNTARIGVVGFVKTMASELAPYGILCNVVAPGFMKTRRIEELAAERADEHGTTPGEVIRELESQIPLGRMGQPEELAALVAFLASERASYITGTTITVDGGFVQAVS